MRGNDPKIDMAMNSFLMIGEPESSGIINGKKSLAVDGNFRSFREYAEISGDSRTAVGIQAG